MSYDLAVFEPEGAPRDPEALAEWFFAVRSEVECTDALAEPATKAMRTFYNEMVREFPDMNGPSGEGVSDTDTLAGYEFRENHIYMDFRWSASEKAADLVIRLALSNNLGLYDLNDGVMFPDFEPEPTPQQQGQSIFSRIAKLFGG